MGENLHGGHRERVRKKVIQYGFDSLEDHQLLELLLFYSIPRVDTNETAHRLLNKYNNSFKDLFNADIDELKEIPGVGESSAVLLKMIPQLAKKYLTSLNEKRYLDTTKAVCDMFKVEFIGDTVEKVRVACLNNKLRLISCTTLYEGSPSKVALEVRNIAEYTYKNKCENIILAHNHPDGDLTPSQEDINSTAKIYKSLKAVGITLLDHIIVADNKAVSMKEHSTFPIFR